MLSPSGQHNSDLRPVSSGTHVLGLFLLSVVVTSLVYKQQQKPA